MDVTLPDGTVLNGVPDGTTKAQLTAKLQSNGYDISKLDAAPEAKGSKSMQWADVPAKAASNLLPSAMNFVSGIYEAVRHPINTFSGLGDLAAGGLRNITPKPVLDFIDRLDPNPQAGLRATEAANAVSNLYRDRYGSMEGLKNTIATDPVGFLADVSTVATGGAAATSKLPLVSKTLSDTARYTNPMGAVVPTTKFLNEKVVSPIVKNTLGLITSVGAENVAQAYQSGKAGKTAFMDNLTGKTGMADVLDTVKQNAQNIGAKASADYRSGMVDVKGDKSILSFNDIDGALKNAYESVTFKGQPKNIEAAKVTQQIADEVNKWKNLDPAEFHTPEGLDALKQRIGGIVDSIPFEEKAARMAASNIYNSVKDEISKQAPTYAKTMKNYSDSIDQIREIERTLSNPKASIDTNLRKLHSLGRNNVNTNYGNRLDLAKSLEQAGGNEFLPDIAGQSMNSWASRGLVGQGGNLATLGSAFANPAMLGLLPFQSPKAVGAMSYGAGKLASLLGKPVENLSPEAVNSLALILSQGTKLTPMNRQDKASK